MRAFAAVVLLLACAAAQQPYRNPVIKKPGMHAEVPDPHVLKFNGEYYLYTSGDPITAYHSTDLVNWSYIGPVFTSSKDPNAWNQADVWAPEVVYNNGKFYLYYTATRKSDDWRVMERERRVGVAVSDSPRGPFVDSGKPLTCTWGIDGHVFRDPDTGEEYLFYSYLDEKKIKGAGIVVDKLLSPTEVACKPSLVTGGGTAWEDKDADPSNGAVRYTNEAPTVMKRDGRYYMLYSGGSWDLPTYNMGYAWSDRIITGGLDGPGWNKVAPPILRSTPLVQAPGHNSVVKAPNNVDDINVYHARKVPFVEPWNRMPFVDRIFFHHDRLFTPQPTTGYQAPPDRPLRQAPPRQPQRIGDYTGDYFVYEINIDHCDEIQIGASPLRWCEGPGYTGGAAARLSKGTNLRQLLIIRNLDTVTVDFDGERKYFQVERGGKVRFRPANTNGIGYTALTPFYEDTFTDSAAGWNHTAGAWNLQDRALVQAEQTGRALTTKGTSANDYEFSASAHSLSPAVVPAPEPQPHKASEALVGIVAAQAASGDLVVAGFDHDYWPFQRFRVRHISGEQVKHEIAVPMPRGFLHQEWHHIRVVKQGDAFTFFLDGAEIAAGRFAIGDAAPGLFTENATAAFDDARWKQIVVPQNLVLNASFDTEQWDGAKAAHDNPWVLKGTARANECCAHSGLRRLLITEGNGTASQTISKLAPGRYRLHAFAIAPRLAAAAVTARVGNSVPVRSAIAGEDWKEATLDFTVTKAADVTISFTATPRAGQFAAADDFYLYQLEGSDVPKQ